VINSVEAAILVFVLVLLSGAMHVWVARKK
jgi:hypothetical protein